MKTLPYSFPLFITIALTININVPSLGADQVAKIKDWVVMPTNYNKLTPPKTKAGEPVSVRIGMNVTQILNVNEAEQSFSIHCHFTQYWEEPRIPFPKDVRKKMALDASWRERLWLPDTYFHNAVDGNGLRLLANPLYFELSNTSRLFMSSRMIIKFSCDMDLTMFPHDTQECHVQIESLTDEIDDVKFSWKYFTLNEHHDFPKFVIENVSHGECLSSRGSQYSCLRASIALKRRLGYYGIRIYGPSLLLVITAFIGFWIPVIGYPARTMIIVTPLLALVTQQSQISNEIDVSYVVALHIWMMACSFFVFMALIELAAAVVYCHSVEDRKEMLKVSDSSADLEAMRAKGHNVVGRLVHNMLNHIYGPIDWTQAPRDRNKIDYCSRIVFPLFYFVFIIIYASALMK